MEYALLFLGLGSAIIAGRVTLLAARGGFTDEFFARQSSLTSIFGALGLPVQIALIIYGFLLFEWWIWIPVALVTIIICGMFVTRGLFAFFAMTQGLFLAVSTACAAYLWFNYF